MHALPIGMQLILALETVISFPFWKNWFPSYFIWQWMWDTLTSPANQVPYLICSLLNQIREIFGRYSFYICVSHDLHFLLKKSFRSIHRHVRSHSQTCTSPIIFKSNYIMVELQVVSPIYFSAFSKICLISMDYFNNQKRYYKKLKHPKT